MHQTLEPQTRTERRLARLRECSPWRAGEDAALRIEFRRGMSIGELASLHRRGSHAVRSRLIAIGELAFDRTI